MATIDKLYNTIKNKVVGNNYANETLERLEEKPEDEDRQISMKSVLKDILTVDQQFKKTVNLLLKEIEQTSGKTINVENSGAVAANQSTVTITGGQGSPSSSGGDAAGRDIHRHQ